MFRRQGVPGEAFELVARLVDAVEAIARDIAADQAHLDRLHSIRSEALWLVRRE